MPTFNYAIRVPPRAHSRLFSTENPLVALDACKASLDLAYGKSKNMKVIVIESPKIFYLHHPNSQFEIDAIIQPGRLLIPVVAIQWLRRGETGWETNPIEMEGFGSVEAAESWVENEVVFSRPFFDQEDGVLVAYAQDCRLSVATIYELQP